MGILLLARSDSAVEEPRSPLEIFGSDLVFWLDASDPSTLTQSGGVVTGWVDKSVNATAMIVDGAPAYSATGLQSHFPAAVLDGVNDHFRAFEVPLGGGAEVTAFIHAEMDEAPDVAHRLLTYYGGGDNLDCIFVFLHESFGLTARAQRNNVLLSHVPGNTFRAQPYVFRRMCVKFDGANNTMYSDRVAMTPEASSGAFGASGVVDIGALESGSFSWKGAVGECVIVKRAATDAERAEMDAWHIRRWNWVLVVVGDSLPWSSHPDINSYPWQYIPNSNPKVWLENLAIPGTKFGAIDGPNSYESRVAEINARIPAIRYGKQYILYFNYTNGIGVWDNGTQGPDATGYTDALGAAAVAAKAAGYDKVLTGTILSRNDQGGEPTFDVLRNSINAIMTAPGWAAAHGFDGVVDLASDEIMGIDLAPIVNPSYFADDVHPNAAGNTRLEVIFRAAINALA